MSAKTKIAWCDSTLNPWEGCTPVSPGCANCYAAARDRRHLCERQDHFGAGKPRRLVKSFEENARRLNRQAASGKRLRVFPSLCDCFDPEVPVERFANFLRVVHETPHLDWLLPTKRPELWYDRTSQVDGEMAESWIDCIDMPERGVVPNNIWIGTSIEDQARADERIPALLKIPARVRFLSCEPLLEQVNLGNLAGIHWVIVGGETGPKARPCNVDWIRDIKRQCQAASVPLFVKQLGTNPEITGADFRNKEHHWLWKMRAHKGGKPSEWPEDLRIREFPNV